jgi:hypothetical protein
MAERTCRAGRQGRKTQRVGGGQRRPARRQERVQHAASALWAHVTNFPTFKLPNFPTFDGLPNLGGPVQPATCYVMQRLESAAVAHYAQLCAQCVVLAAQNSLGQDQPHLSGTGQTTRLSELRL